MKLRWGILGAARISRRGLIPGIHGSETGILLGLASRDGRKARAWAEEFSIPRTYGSYADLLADAEINVVYIPLPNELHRPWVEAAADAGKHVLCEKPLALNAAEARAMVEHCRDRGVTLMEAFMWRHHPRAKELRARVAEGRLGELRLVRASFSFPIEPDDWRLDPARGGGALWDVGCYGIDAARFFTGGEPTQFRASARWSEKGVDLGLAAALEFPDGVLASIDCAFDQPDRCSLELVGSEASLEVPNAFIPSPIEPALALLKDQSGASHTLEFPAANQYAAMVDAFARAVATGGLVEGGENGLATMEALDAVLASAKE